MNSSFSPSQPTLQYAWDSTSLGALKTCPRLYKYSIIDGLQPHATSVHLTFGLYYHAALEAYDYARAQGADHEASQISAVQRALTDTWHDDRPWNSNDPNKNRLTLVRSIVWYLEEFSNDTLRTHILANSKPAVELSFRFETGQKMSSGDPLILCGHMDRIVELQESYYVLDRKTTKNTLNHNFFKKFNPDNQFSLYTIAGKVAFNVETKGIICDAAQIAVTFSRFLRAPIIKHREQSEEWLENLQYYISQAEIYSKRNYWPQNDKACQNYGGCPFLDICSKPPSIREKWLKAAYYQRIWDPLKVRGDI